MAKVVILVMICAFMLLISTVHSSGDPMSWLPVTRSGNCQGSMADCGLLSEEEEFDLDSESNRRILATTSYISYGALQRNRVPCSRRGASYYNCRSGAQANPYSRGCSAITRCRS